MLKLAHALLLISFCFILISCDNTITIETKENFEQAELPDGSIIYVNNNSKISYDPSFNPRKIKLNGEAFFSVNDGETPFVIVTEEGDEVIVLGTEFNLISSSKGLMVEVEIGLVSLKLGSGKIYKEVGRGHRLDFGRHDNGLHLGQAKHQYRSWISVMNNNFKSSGLKLKRSQKHSAKNLNQFKKQNSKQGKPLIKGNSPAKSKPFKNTTNSKSPKGGTKKTNGAKGNSDKGGKGKN